MKRILIYLSFLTILCLGPDRLPLLGILWAEPVPSPIDAAEEAALEEPTGSVTLEQAVTLALSRHPELKAVSREVHALDAQARQAGLLPNPELEIETENFGGQGEFRDFDSAETTIQLRQLVELAGKRSKRKGLALLEQNLGEWDYAMKRAAVQAQVTRAFVATLAAQERMALKKEAVALAERVLNAVTDRFKAGKVSSLEETRAGVAYSRSLIELERAKHRLEAARRGLAATWGSPNPLFKNLSGSLDPIRPLPSLNDLAQHISRNPEMARWATEMKQRKAVVKLEMAKRVPDVKVGGGWRRSKESEDDAYVMNLSVPLPFFNQNQGNVQAARQRLVKAEEEKKMTELRISSELAAAYQVLSTAYFEAETLKEKVLPGAQRTFDATTEGYRLGKFDYLLMLDAHRTLFDVRDQYIEALASYHNGVAEVERLIGGPMYSDAEKPVENTQGASVL
ncbi:MAG: TolC family protein [bacterium]|nr:TolC family protein [bacterium]